MNTENKMEQLEKSMHGMIDAAFRLQRASENANRGNDPNYPSGSFVGNGGGEYVKGGDPVIDGFKNIADKLSAAPDEHDFCANAQSTRQKDSLDRHPSINYINCRCDSDRIIPDKCAKKEMERLRDENKELQNEVAKLKDQLHSAWDGRNEASVQYEKRIIEIQCERGTLRQENAKLREQNDSLRLNNISLTNTVEYLSPTFSQIRPGEDPCVAFKRVCEPLIKYLQENHHPHVTVIATSNGAELLEGQISTGIPFNTSK